jgi:hypothetical protein
LGKNLQEFNPVFIEGRGALGCYRLASCTNACTRQHGLSSVFNLQSAVFMTSFFQLF